MPRPRKSDSPPKQGPPVAFRAGPDLSKLVAGYAAGWGVGAHEAFKDLAALAAVGLDVRHYDLVAASAAGTGGANAFVRAVLRISAGLVAAAEVDPKFARDPDRTLLLVRTVWGQLAAAGAAPPVEAARALLARVGVEFPRDDAADWGRAEVEVPGHYATNFGRRAGPLEATAESD